MRRLFVEPLAAKMAVQTVAVARAEMEKVESVSLADAGDFVRYTLLHGAHRL